MNNKRATELVTDLRQVSGSRSPASLVEGSIENHIETLKTKRKLHVKADTVEFWILYKPCPLGSPALFCAGSEDGKRPSAKFRPFNKYRLFSYNELYNWIAHLEILDQ
jgi:hypothetical protein